MSGSSDRSHPSARRPHAPRHVSVLVVGAGFGGLAMAIKLDEAGSDDFVVARARQRRRRHLARQHLPGRRLRRALAPVLVLVRAQPGLVAHLLPPAARSRPTSQSVADDARRARPHPPSTPTSRTRDLGRDRAALARRAPTPATLTADVARLRHRRALPSPTIPDIDGPGRLRGRGLPLRALGPRPRPDRQAGRRHRHRRLGRSRSCPRSPTEGRRSSTSTSAPRRG